MSNTILSQSDIIQSSIPERVRERPDGTRAATPGGDLAARIAGLEAELRRTRADFETLRQSIDRREKSGAALMDACRSVLTDLGALFEAQRKEYDKREESLRFFLNSIQARLKSDIRSELNEARRWWPFRRRR